MAVPSRSCIQFARCSQTAWDLFNVRGTSACSTVRAWPSASRQTLTANISSVFMKELCSFDPIQSSLQGNSLFPNDTLGSSTPKFFGFWGGRAWRRCRSRQMPLDGQAVLEGNLEELPDGAFMRSSLDGGGKLEKTRCVDVAVLGNFCLDIVLNVASLPSKDLAEKFKYMQQLEASPPDEGAWEAGGNSNFAIAASRLGLQTAAIGHVGEEKFGRFLVRVLEKEGITMTDIEDEDVSLGGEDYDGSTLICWVLVDHEHNHSFCSRFDFNKDPVFSGVKRLPARVEAVIRGSRALFCNGFAFDELSPAAILSAVECAQVSGSVVFFDPGPRGKSLFRGSAEQKAALEQLLNCCAVLLLTSEEAEALTGIADPLLSSRSLLNKGQNTKWVVVKLGEKGCLLATSKRYYRACGFKVDVIDTVGCGDSFAAAIVLGFIRNIPVETTVTLANAVGAATAKGCGAGRNVASPSQVIEILSSSEVISEIDFDRKFEDSECSVKNVTYIGKVKDDNLSIPSISVEAVAKDALILLHAVLNQGLIRLQT